MAYDDFRIYPESQPLAVQGGIKAKSKRGAFGENWWSKRWDSRIRQFQPRSSPHPWPSAMPGRDRL